MYLQEIPKDVMTTTLIKIKYDCCGKEHILKHKDANKNYQKNQQKHICRSCGLKSNNPASRADVREKMKQTCLERYGTTCSLNTIENTKSRVEKMFGTEESTQQIVAKRRTTSIEKYGTAHPMQNETVKEKQQAVIMEKYGVKVPLQNEEIKAKMQQTNMERHGVKNVASLPEVRLKMAQTTFEKYGVEHYNQLPDMKDYLREHCKEWLAESYANPWAKGITRPEEWNQKQSETVCGLIESGEWQGGGRTYKGWYKAKKCLRENPMYRSGYELQVHFHLDQDEDVEFYDYEPFQIPYYDSEGKRRHYTVDFLVKRKDHPLLLIEVKNNYSEPEFLMGPKYLVIKQLAAQYGMVFEIWSNKQIKLLGSDLHELLEDERVTYRRASQ